MAWIENDGNQERFMLDSGDLMWWDPEIERLVVLTPEGRHQYFPASPSARRTLPWLRDLIDATEGEEETSGTTDISG